MNQQRLQQCLGQETEKENITYKDDQQVGLKYILATWRLSWTLRCTQLASVMGQFHDLSWITHALGIVMRGK
jgi:hypothetical protein